MRAGQSIRRVDVSRENMDLQTPVRILLLSLVIAAMETGVALMTGDKAITYGIIAGSFISISFYLVICWIARTILRSSQDEKAGVIELLLAMIAFVLKFIFLGVFLWYIFKTLEINPFALVCGIAVTQVAILIAGLNNLQDR